MGKKVEKGKDKEKAASAKGHVDDTGDDEHKTPGRGSGRTSNRKHMDSRSRRDSHTVEQNVYKPHVCTGNFNNDFTELCRRAQMVVIPPVVVRAHRPPSPSQAPSNEDKKGQKGKDKNPQPEPEPEELNEDGEPVDPPPKTYTTKEKFDYFKPTVQVEMDHPDKGDTVTEIFIRGWKIDATMMNIFRQCWVAMEKLHTITLWNAGLTSETLSILGSFLPLCPNVKNLTLDGNNLIKEENFDVLLVEDSLIQNLSLRYCAITDVGAAKIGKMLGNPSKQNTKLLSLNLTGNKIGDAGAASIAHGLRMNRALLSLTLASNKIGNEGAKIFGETLSRFPLTHEEVVERRRLMSDKGGTVERAKSSHIAVTTPEEAIDIPKQMPVSYAFSEHTSTIPPPSRRADSKDRPGSVRSSSHTDKGKDKTRDKSSKTKKGEKEEKLDKTKGKGGKDDKTLKKDPRGSKASAQGSQGGRASGGASVVVDTKAATKGKDKKGKDKKGAVAQESEPETPENLSPLLDVADHIDGGLWIAGNRVLINLNLSRNMIGEDGVKGMLSGMQYQTTLTAVNKGGSGLMRIALHKNTCNLESEELIKLHELMLTKDPFYKPPPSTPELES